MSTGGAAYLDSLPNEYHPPRHRLMCGLLPSPRQKQILLRNLTKEKLQQPVSKNRLCLTQSVWWIMMKAHPGKSLTWLEEGRLDTTLEIQDPWISPNPIWRSETGTSKVLLHQKRSMSWLIKVRNTNCTWLHNYIKRTTLGRPMKNQT